VDAKLPSKEVSVLRCRKKSELKLAFLFKPIKSKNMFLKKTQGLLLLLIYVLVLITPNVLVSFIINDPSLSINQKISPIFLALAAQAFLFAIVRRATFFLLLQIPFFLWLPMEVMYSFRYGAPTSAHVLNIVVETSYAEALGYIGHPWVISFYLIYVVILILGICVFWGANITWSHRSRWWVMISVGGSILIYGLMSNNINDRVDKTLENLGARDEFLSPQFSYGLDSYKDVYPFGLILRWIEYYKQKTTLKNTLLSVKLLSSGYERETLAKEEIYIVIIGESSRSDHWGLNGYSRNTTPLLSARDDIVSFSNAVSASAATRTAVPILLSRSSAEDVLKSNLKNSWINDFKVHGFKTYWFSTQMPVGTHDTMIGAYAGMVDALKYLNLGRYSIHSDFDEVLIPSLQVALQEPSEKKLIVLHTLGSHTPYHFRYPESFTYFKPAFETNSFANIFDKSRVNMLRNGYDNSVRYTDYLLNEIITILEKRNSYSALWYISDHGETFIDEDCLAAGHGFASKYNFHIPLIFWSSKKYKLLNDEKMNATVQLKNKPVFTTDFFDTMMQTAGFKSNSHVFNGFLGASYISPKRFVATLGAASYDYDEEYLKNECGNR